MTRAAGTWLVVDNTYESFLFSGSEHVTIGGPNTVHVFSFSKVISHCLLLACLKL